MQTGLFKTAHPFTKILLVLFLMFTCYLILFGLGLVVSIIVFDVSASEVVSIIEKRQVDGNIPMIRMMQVLYSTGLFLIPAILAACMINGRASEYLEAGHMPGAVIILMVAVLMFTIIPLVNYAGLVNEKLVLSERWGGLMEKIRGNDESQWKMMEAFLDTRGAGGLLLNLFMIAVIPAIGEELLFRGTLQKILSEWFGRRHIAVWVTALLFSLAHFQLAGFLPRLLLGGMFGYLFVWTASIWIPVIAHFINNGIGVAYYYLFYRGSVAMDPDRIGIERHSILFLLSSILVTILLMAAIRRTGKGSADAHVPGIE